MPTKTPKFLLSKSNKGDEFIIHTMHPRCIGIVWQKNELLRVYMQQKFDELDAEQENTICKEMKNWYFFSKQSANEANNITGIQRDNPLSVHLLQSVFLTNRQLLIFHKDMVPADFMEANQEWLNTLPPKILEAYKHTVTRKEVIAAITLFLKHYPF